MEKLYYGLTEAASIVGETPVTVRYWSNTFGKFLAVKRNAKGNRLFTASDLEVLRRIHYLTRECGLSLEAVGRKLSGKTGDGVDMLEIRASLLRIRAQLEQIKSEL